MRRSRSVSTTRCFVVALLALAAFGCGRKDAASTSTTNSSRRRHRRPSRRTCHPVRASSNPRADELVHQMSDRLAQVPAFALEAEEVFDEVPEQSRRQQLTNTRHVALRRPGGERRCRASARSRVRAATRPSRAAPSPLPGARCPPTPSPGRTCTANPRLPAPGSTKHNASLSVALTDVKVGEARQDGRGDRGGWARPSVRLPTVVKVPRLVRRSAAGWALGATAGSQTAAVIPAQSAASFTVAAPFQVDLVTNVAMR